jgi:hypothetical protein
MEIRALIILTGYIFFIILQIIVINRNKIKRGRLNNNNNPTLLLRVFRSELLKRVRLLHSKQMDYSNWIEYNTKNSIINIHNRKFYFFIFEYINSDKFLTKVHANKTYINLDWNDIIKDQKEYFPYIKEETNVNLISNMFSIGQYDKTNSMRYYWIDPIEKTLVLKESTFLKWIDKTNNKSGVIGIGYDIDNIIDKHKLTYSNYIHMGRIILLNIVIATIAFITYTFNSNTLKPLLFLLVIGIYIIHYYNSSELIGSFQTEHTKIKSISDSLLGLSFLIVATTFILKSMRIGNDMNLFIESGLTFSVAIILLLMCLFKVTNYTNIYELTIDRISNQMIFNVSILLNIMVVINYAIYMRYKL